MSSLIFHSLFHHGRMHIGELSEFTFFVERMSASAPGWLMIMFFTKLPQEKVWTCQAVRSGERPVHRMPQH